MLVDEHPLPRPIKIADPSLAAPKALRASCVIEKIRDTAAFVWMREREEKFASRLSFQSDLPLNSRPLPDEAAR